MKLKIISSVILLALCCTARAQQPDSAAVYTLEECTRMALESNASVRNARNSAQAASELRKEAFTKYFPEVSAQGFAFTTKSYVLQYEILDLIQFDMIKKGMAGGVQLLQPIFLGGEIVNGNKLAKVGEVVADLRSRQNEREVRLTTSKYYWKLATLKATRTTLTSAIDMLDTLASQVHVAVDAGIALNNDYLKVDLLRNDFKSKLVDLDNGIKLMRMLLSQYVGVSMYEPLDIRAEVPDSVPDFPVSVYVQPVAALDSTVDYSLLKANVRAKELEKRIEIGRNLPQVVGGVGYYYHTLLHEGHGFWAFMVGVNVPLSGWWGGSHAIKRKNLELLSAQNELTDKSELLQLEMESKWDDLTAAHRKMTIARQAIDQSTENLRLNRVFYEAGTSTITDLLEAETLFKDAHDRYDSAYGEFRVAKAAYLVATGRQP